MLTDTLHDAAQAGTISDECADLVRIALERFAIAQRQAPSTSHLTAEEHTLTFVLDYVTKHKRYEK